MYERMQCVNMTVIFPWRTFIGIWSFTYSEKKCLVHPTDATDTEEEQTFTYQPGTESGFGQENTTSRVGTEVKIAFLIHSLDS